MHAFCIFINWNSKSYMKSILIKFAVKCQAQLLLKNLETPIQSLERWALQARAQSF